MKYGEINVKVGNEVRVLPDANKCGGGTFTVSRVGRKLIAIQQYGRERTFDKLTRCERTDGIGGYCRVLTPDEHAAYVHRVAVVERVRTLTSDYRWTDNLSVSTLERVVELLEAEAK